jgi:hypothetical protein
MTTPVEINPLLASSFSTVPPVQTILSKSLRFRAASTCWLSRTPTVAATDGTKFTYSVWVKRGAIPSIGTLLNAYIGPTLAHSYAFDTASGGVLYGIYGGSVYVQTTNIFVDPSAWYHIVIAADSNQVTPANRLKLYVNGVLSTQFTGASVSPGQVWQFTANATPGGIGNQNILAGLASFPFDGYMSQIYMVDGQQLAATSFGQFNSTTGVWEPIVYTGTYGNNGYYLPLTNTTSTTTLCADASGNGNNWTPNNISLTSGSTYDSMIDIPCPQAIGTIYPSSNPMGNYATLNPWIAGASALTNGNLTSAGATNLPTLIPSTGKWYFEINGTGFTWSPPAAFPGNIAGDYNFGQQPFSNAMPAGTKTLCSTNLPSVQITINGTFTGNASAAGPFVYLNGNPVSLTINGNVVTWGVHADKMSNGFKVITNSAAYNATGSNTYVVTTSGKPFRYGTAQQNP